MALHLKVLVVGDRNVGKSTFINQLKLSSSHHNEDKDAVRCIDTMYLSSSSKSVQLNLMDCSGDWKLREIVCQQLDDFDACIIMYDVSHRKSFDSAIYNWYNIVKAKAYNVRQLRCTLLLGNKCDYDANLPTREVHSPDILLPSDQHSKSYNQAAASQHLFLSKHIYEITEEEHSSLASYHGITFTVSPFLDCMLTIKLYVFDLFRVGFRLSMARIVNISFNGISIEWYPCTQPLLRLLQPQLR
jgi:small GTP-binding protein